MSAQHPNRDRLDRMFRDDPYAATLGVELVDWGGGWSRVRYEADAGHHNFAGVAHGGSMFSVGDVAFAVASNSWGRRAVALAVDTHFLAAPAPGTEVVAEAHERSRTRRTGSYRIELTADGRPVASLHAMVYRLDSWYFAEDDWPEEWRHSH